MKTTALILIALFGLLSFLSGCGHSAIRFDEPAVTGSKGPIVIWASWVKPKGDKYDLNLNIENTTSDFVIVFLSDLACFQGDQKGDLKHTFFNTGERTIDFGPHQHKDFNAVCRLASDGVGDYRIVVGSVFSNPSHDRKTSDKEIAKNVEWKGVVKTAE